MSNLEPLSGALNDGPGEFSVCAESPDGSSLLLCCTFFRAFCPLAIGSKVSGWAGNPGLGVRYPEYYGSLVLSQVVSRYAELFLPRKLLYAVRRVSPILRTFTVE